MKSYPRFCRTIADQYSAYHSRGQRVAQARLLYRVNAINSEYQSEEDVMSQMQILDEDFETDVPEPTHPEE